MKSGTRSPKTYSAAILLGLGLMSSGLWLADARAQSPQMQERLSEVKTAIEVNKLLLAQYSWTEQDIISIKGEQKKEELYNVQIGPNGKPQKTPVDPNSVSDDERHRRGLRGRIIERKIEEYKEYAEQIKSLVQQYLPPDKDMLQQAYQQGNVLAGPEGGAPGEYRLVISNYVKQGDNMTLVMNKPQKALVSVSISTYLDDPSDAVKVNVQFSKIPNGPNHVTTEAIDGVKKQLRIEILNTNYQHM